MQEFFGYCLTEDTSKQKSLIQVGKPRSGKGTCQFILQRLLGKDNWCSYDLSMLPKDFGLSPLVNRQVAIVGEVELKSNPHKTLIMEKLKSIIGEDAQSINKKHEEISTIKLPTRFVIATNTLPHFFDASKAIATRFLFLSHEISFAGRENENLRQDLLSEIEGITNWALQGLIRLQSSGKFTLPESHKKLHQEFELNSSPVSTFIEETLMIQKCIDPGDLHKAMIVSEPCWISRDECYQLYVDWCGEHDLQPTDRSYFGRDIRTAFPKIPERSKKCINGTETSVYIGLGKRPTIEPSVSTEPTETQVNQTEDEVDEIDYTDDLLTPPQ